MIRKIFTILFATVLTLASGSAFAGFEDMDLIRVYYDGGSNEYVTALGNVNTILAGSAITVPGSFGSLPTGRAVYFAINRTLPGQVWASGSPAVATTSIGSITTLSSAVNASFNSWGGSVATSYSGPSSLANSYYKKFSGGNVNTIGTLTNFVSSALRLNTEINIAGLINGTDSTMTQTLYYFATATAAGATNPNRTGVAVATIVTNADGSTTITPTGGAPTPTAPGVTIDATSSITQTAATLNGRVSANNAGVTSISFNYGLNISYGSTMTATPTTLAANAVNSPVAAAINGLSCGSLYHFNIVATNSAGTTNGPDQSFTTAACSQAIIPISFTPPNLTVGSASTANTSASSGLPIKFATTTPTICNVTGSTVTGITEGLCTVTADQPGDTTFAAAPQVSQDITVVAPIIKINAAKVPLNTIALALSAPNADAVVLVQAAPVFVEDVLMNNPVTIQLKGGFTDANFSSQTSITTIKGSLTVKSGTLRVSHFNIRPNI
jgi:hypothetical protein